MGIYLLTTEQKLLLRSLVHFIETGKLKEPIVPFPAEKPASQFVIYLQGEDSFKFKRISDLDSLCDAGLLRYRWNRFGNGKLYYVTEAGVTAVSNNFQSPAEPSGQDLPLTLLTATLSGQSIQIAGLEESTTLGEIASDPILRHTAVSHLIVNLQKTAEKQLPWAEYRSYYQLAQQLEEALLAPQPKMLKLQALFTQLAAPQTTLAAWPLLWAYLHPLLLLAHLRTR